VLYRRGSTNLLNLERASRRYARDLVEISEIYGTQRASPLSPIGLWISFFGWGNNETANRPLVRSPALDPSAARPPVALLCTCGSRSKRRSNLTAAWQIRGNFSANPWRPVHPSPSRIRREKASSCRMKNPRRGFASSSSQRNRMTLVFGTARFWRPGLNASPGSGFRITPRGMRAAPRRSCGTSPSSNDGFWSVQVRVSRHADQTLEAPRFFTVISTPNGENCLQSAATRLKFAARPLDSHHQPPDIELKPFSRRPISPSQKLPPVADIDKMSGDRSGRRHRRRHQMGAALESLAALEVAVRGRGAAFFRGELVGIHR
jgi:hypothetical protein